MEKVYTGNERMKEGYKVRVCNVIFNADFRDKWTEVRKNVSEHKKLETFVSGIDVGQI